MPQQSSSLFKEEIADAGELSPIKTFFFPFMKALEEECILQRMNQVQ